MKVKVCQKYQKFFPGIPDTSEVPGCKLLLIIKRCVSKVSKILSRYQKCLDARPAAGRDQEVPNSRNSIGGIAKFLPAHLVRMWKVLYLNFHLCFCSGATIKNMFGAFNKKSRSPEVSRVSQQMIWKYKKN